MGKPIEGIIKRYSDYKYTLLMRIMHWLLAIMIISLFIVGVLMTEYMEAPGKFYYYKMHKAFGMVTLFLVILRVIIRLRSKIPPTPPISYVELFLYNIGLISLYAFMIIIPLSGYIMSDAGNYAIDFFGYILPNIIPKNPKLAGISYTIHTTGVWIFAAIIIIHIAASFKHYFIDKMNLFKRIT